MGEVIRRFDTKMKASGYPKAAEVRNRKLALIAKLISIPIDQGRGLRL
jgi:hypothetical protein